MKALLPLARAIDALNTGIGRLVYWLVLVTVVISAGNAMIRYMFDMSSNAWLELQWYLFSAVFLLAAPYTLLRNEMVRIDVISSRLSQRANDWIEIVGTVLFLLPFSLGLLYLTWPVAIQSFTRGEMSANAGGLILWPARALMPLGFFLLSLQGISQLIKQIAFMRGEAPDPNAKVDQKSAEQELAEEIERMRAAKLGERA